MAKLDKIFQFLPYSNFFASKEPEVVIDKKFQIMSQASLSREDKIQKLSTVNQFDFNDAFGNGTDKYSYGYQNMLGMNIPNNKLIRIREYRELANAYAVKTALLEICNEFIAKDAKTHEIVKIDLPGLPDETVNRIRDEFKSFMKTTFNLEKNGFRDIWCLLTEGELFFENIISVQKPEMGILGLTKIDTMRIEPIYFDVENELLDHFQLQKKIHTDQQQTQTYQQNNVTTNLILSKNQVTYVSSNEWDVEKRYRLPLIDNVRTVFRKYNFVEDACVIYMITRAPDRLLFKVPVGTTDPLKVERTMQQAISRLTTKKNLGWDGKVQNTYDPQHITENYFLPVMGGNTPQPDITSVAGGTQIPAVMEIVTFFQKEIYKHLQIPISRMDTATQYSDGTEITRDELKFSFFVERLQKMYADAIKKTFIIHLKLKNKKLHLYEACDPEMKRSVFWEKLPEITANFHKNHNWFVQQRWDRLQNISEEIKGLRKEAGEVLTEAVEGELEKMIIENRIELLVAEADELRRQAKDAQHHSKSMWESFELQEEDLNVRFNLGSSFQTLRTQQQFQIDVDNMSNLSQNPLMSFNYLMKTIMGWTDEQILANRAWRKRDAETAWEIANIEAQGPDFRNAPSEGAEGGGLDGGGGGGGGPGGPGLGGGGGGPSPDDTKLADLKNPDGGPEGAPPAGGADKPEAPAAEPNAEQPK